MLPKDREFERKARLYLELIKWMSENWVEITRFYLYHHVK